MAARITLGKKYRDIVSGWEGTATARFEYLNKCVRILLAGPDDKGQPVEYTFDIEQLEPVAAPPVKLTAEPTGGPRDLAPPPRR